MHDDTTIAPHGGELVDLLVPEGRRDATRAETDHLPRLVVNARELSDLEMLTVGALSPLTGIDHANPFDRCIVSRTET